jgi:hypothetical protein
MAVDHLAELSAAGGADHAGDGEHHRARPFDGPRPAVAEQICRGACSHRDGTGADGRVGRRHADDVDHQRHGQDRAATTNEAQREADKAAGEH